MAQKPFNIKSTATGTCIIAEIEYQPLMEYQTIILSLIPNLIIKGEPESPEKKQDSWKTSLAQIVPGG